MLSVRAIEVLKMMIAAEEAGDYDEAEIVCDGNSIWLASEKLHRKTINSLIQHVAVSFASEPGSLERYTINGTGRQVVLDPSVAERVVSALIKGEAVDEKGNPMSKD